MDGHKNNGYARVGKTWLSCHDHTTMMAKNGRDHAMMTHGGHVFWHGRHDSGHYHGMITMFSTIHTVIMV